MLKLRRALIFVFVVFALGILLVTFRVRRMSSHDTAPKGVNFCYFATHRQEFWDQRILATARIEHDVEGAALYDRACPLNPVLFETSLENSDYKWEMQNMNRPFDPELSVSFEGELCFFPPRKNLFRKALRVLGIKTQEPGVLVIRRITTLDKVAH
jgi:hypothetical protein